MARITVIKPGMLTTFQDLGRKGYQRFGVTQAGAMDVYSHKLANIIVGNELNTSTLEMTMVGPILKFDNDAIISITGSDFNPTINGNQVLMNRTVKVNKGEILNFSNTERGCRGYLAIKGGFQLEKELGSSSVDLKVNLGGLNGKALVKGDTINFNKSSDYQTKVIPKKVLKNYQTRVIRVVEGLQFDSFSKEGIDTFFSNEYQLRETSDRMGLRFSGQQIKALSSHDIISDAISFGAIQVPHDGQPIIMMADRQTTGGYPKIANVISIDLPILAQLTPGDKIHFTLVSVEEAQDLLVDELRLIERLKDFITKQNFADYRSYIYENR